MSTMDGDKETQKELSDGNLQHVQKETGDHLPDNSKMVKENGEPEDGVEEKLVSEDGALKSSEVVKFISVDSQNGDAKIDIENMKIAFAGMGKEELMKFANDPFWVRLRWFLFILFWLLWAAMLAGAVAIIVMAPKCTAPAPLKWWEQSPLYQVFVPAFKDSGDDGTGDLKGVQSKLDYIQDLGVKGVVLSSVNKVTTNTNEEAVEDFEEVDPQYGTLADLKALVAAAKSKGLHLIMSFIPNHTSNKHPWFVKSENNDTLYKDYYVWSSGPVKFDSLGTREPPNNWRSVTGGSAWEWSDKRQAFYLHQFHTYEPDLNFRNPAVVEEYKGIFKFWLDLGISGLQFEKVEYLLEDPGLQDEVPVAPPGVLHDEYDFYSHTKTLNLPGITDILAEWKAVVQNYTDSDRMLSVIGNLTIVPSLDQNNNSFVPVDLLQNGRAFVPLRNGFTASDILNKTVIRNLEMSSNGLRPNWQLSTSTSSRVPSRFSPEYVDGLNMISLLLPGTPVTLYGEEIGMEDSMNKVAYPARCLMSWKNTSNAGFTNGSDSAYSPCSNYESVNVEAQLDASDSSLSVYKELVAARNTPSIMYGTRDFAIIGNNTVFAFTRIKSGNPGYLVAFNTADEEVTVSFKDLELVPEELNVLIKSSNFNIPGIKAKSKLNRDAVRLSPKGALVATFVPKTD